MGFFLALRIDTAPVVLNHADGRRQGSVIEDAEAGDVSTRVVGDRDHLSIGRERQVTSGTTAGWLNIDLLQASILEDTKRMDRAATFVIADFGYSIEVMAVIA